MLGGSVGLSLSNGVPGVGEAVGAATFDDTYSDFFYNRTKFQTRFGQTPKRGEI